MTRFLLALPLLAACTHTPCDAVWPRTCEERDGGLRAVATVDPKPAEPPKAEPDDKPDDNGAASSDDSNDENGGKS